MLKIRLNEKEKRDLLKKYSKLKNSKGKDKIRAILMLNNGYSRLEISSILLVDEKTVTTWKKSYVDSTSLEDFLGDNYGGYRGKLFSAEKKS